MKIIKKSNICSCKANAELLANKRIDDYISQLEMVLHLIQKQ